MNICYPSHSCPEQAANNTKDLESMLLFNAGSHKAELTPKAMKICYCLTLGGCGPETDPKDYEYTLPV